MSSRIIYGGLAMLVLAFFAVVVIFKSPEAPRPGVSHDDKGGGHVATKVYGEDAPPVSGEHSTTAAWGIHKEEVADVNVLHNLEHGGIYISYQPDIPEEEIKKIEQLFSLPSSRGEFNPAKAVVAPRAANKEKIVVSSWNRSEVFQEFDEAAMYEYYVRNIGKSPEPFGT